jgi:hypothetical protein
MTPQRVASVRAANRPMTLVSFRDDIGLRYEETKQADAPIPLPPPRNPARVTRQYSSFTTTIASPTNTVSTTTTTTIPRIPPSAPTSPATEGSRPPHAFPKAPPRPIRPPQHEHPALRGEPSPPISDDETSKRSSTDGDTPVSSVTSRDEFQDDLHYDKWTDDEVTSIYSTDIPAPSPASPAYPLTSRRLSQGKPTLNITTVDLPPPPMQSVFTDTPDLSPASESGNPWDMLMRPRTPGHSRSVSLPKKLGKTFSVKSGGTKLRKKNLSESGITVPSIRSDAHSIKAPSVTAVGSVVHFLTPLQSRGNRLSFQAPKMAASAGPPEWALAPPPRPPTPEPLALEDIDASPTLGNFDFGPTSPPPPVFTPLTTRIPNNRLMDEKFLAQMIFSDKGSMIIPEEPEPVEEPASSIERYSLDSFAGTSIVPVLSAPPAPQEHYERPTTITPERDSFDPACRPSLQEQVPPTPPPPARASKDMATPEIRVVSVDASRESQKVRSLYEAADDSLHWQDGSGRGASPAAGGESLAPTAEVPSDGEDNAVYGCPRRSSCGVPRLDLVTQMLTVRVSNLQGLFKAWKRPVHQPSYKYLPSQHFILTAATR